jgi:dCMP deaminase
MTTGMSTHYRQEKWDMRFLGLARYISSFSKDPSTKVGAVIARPDNTALSWGFNGFPRRCDDDPEIYADRERKYERVVHAEMNAILIAPERPKGCALFVWPPALAPGTCGRCAAAIIQAGVTRVVRVHTDSSGFNERWQASYREALEMYTEAGVTVTAYRLDEFQEWMKATQGSSS